MCLLAQLHPIESRDSEGNRLAQRSHAHHVCGIVAHTKDRGVASVAIRSLAIAGAVLTDHRERMEVVAILERTSKETGWRLGKVLSDLKEKWGWEPVLPPRTLAPLSTIGGGTSLPGGAAQSMNLFSAVQQPLATTGTAHSQVVAPRPTRPIVNPLLANADFTHQNHPYQSWYEPPNQIKGSGNALGSMAEMRDAT